MKEVVFKMMQEEVLIGTWSLSKGFKVEHRALKKLIFKYKEEFEQLGFIASPMQQITDKKRKKGRQVEEYLLNEPQATYISTLLTNNETVRKFKLFLTKEFFRQRKLLSKLLAQRHNAEWLEKRANGKIERRLETDTIKSFVEYAEVAGSKNAKKYYVVISKMQNRTLFNLEFLEQKYPNIRNMVNGFGLDALKMSDHIVSEALKEGMEQVMFYKDIFKKAKDRVERFALVLGKTPLQITINETQQIEE